MTKQRYNTNTEDATKRQNICLEVVKIARDDRQVKALAAFHLLKQYYHNSRIYNYRTRMKELAEIIGVSRSTLYTYFDYLNNIGLLTTSGENLLLRSTGKLKRCCREKKKYQITISDHETLQTIEARLCAKLMEDHMRTIEYHKRIRRFERRYAGRRNAQKKRRGESGPGYTLSIRNLQKLFNMGRIKTARIIFMLNDMGVIHTTKTRAQKAAKAPGDAAKYMDGLPGHFYVLNGHMYIKFGNKHEPLEHPPTMRQLTYGQYIAIYRRKQKNA